MQGNAWVATMVTHKEHYNNRDINIHKDVIKCYRMLDNNIGQKWPILYSMILNVHTYGLEYKLSLNCPM